MASKYSKPIICFLSLFTCLLMISCNVFVKDSPTDIKITGTGTLIHAEA